MSKKRLGRGLSVLFQETESVNPRAGGSVQEVDINSLEPGTFQPRAIFDEQLIQELSDSIKENGVLQPIVIRPSRNKDVFEIIAGERRWRAAKAAGLQRIPAITRDVEDKIALELGLIENIQRKSLTPIEEAAGYQKLLREFHYTQEELSKKVGKSRSHISNLLRLLELPGDVQKMVNSEELSMGHARTLVGKENAVELAQEIVNNKLSVRAAENLTRDPAKPSVKQPKNEQIKAPSSAPAAKAAESQKDDDLIALENALSGKLGLDVEINDKHGEGTVSIHFHNLMDLDTIIQRLSAA
jgi:ParB family chromosome partitioning protein